MAHESVVVDTSFFPRLRRIDDDCGLLEFVIDCFGPLAIADRGQLEKMGSCPNARKLFTDHGISDEDVMVWIGDSGPETEQRFLQHAVSDDLIDIKLLQYASNADGATLLTNDKWVLFMADDMGIAHFCFKAALSETDSNMGGAIFADPNYQTNKMEEFGDDPFFHYGHDKNCPKCDADHQCAHRRDRG